MPNIPPITESSLKLRSMAVEVTGRCNQRCAYCYNAWRGEAGPAPDPSNELLKQRFDKLISQADLKYLSLTGGEPFMRDDLLDIIGYLNSRGLGVTVISNGGLLDEKLVSRLARHKVHYVQLTLAGADPGTHDGVCGPGSFSGVVNAIELLQNAGIRAYGSYLCTRQSAPQAGAVFEKFAALGVRHVAFNRFNPAGYSTTTLRQLMPTRSEVIVALESANAVAGDKGIKATCTMPIPQCVVERKKYPAIKFGGCSAGTKHAEYAVGMDGCLRLCTVHGRRLGSIDDTPLTDILASDYVACFRAEIPEFCTECPLAKSCLGGCGAAADWVFGSGAKLDPFVAQHVDPSFKSNDMPPQSQG